MSSAIRQLQSGRVGQQELLQTMRDKLDQFKRSIDAMDLPPGDVTALLVKLRDRMEPRLAPFDFERRWCVDLRDPVWRLDAQDVPWLQFMVFEGRSNVMQHAGAYRGGDPDHLKKEKPDDPRRRLNSGRQHVGLARCAG